jgi:hypothetical protein
MRRLLWITLGSVLTMLTSAVGWFVSGGWHTNELVLINYLQDGRKVAIYDMNGGTILAPANEARVWVYYDMAPGKGTPIIHVEKLPPQLGDYSFPCDGDVHYVVVGKDGTANSFGIREGGFLVGLRRSARCLLK